MGSETILVVEDYPPIRAMVREILCSLGYHVLAASDGEDALRASRAHDGTIHLLVTDVVMPRLGGKDLAAILGAERPGIKVLYSSGYTEEAIVQQGVLRPGVAFIAKPYRPGEIADKVRAVLDA
jgi:CheY-like chemotaxis protein